MTTDSGMKYSPKQEMELIDQILTTDIMLYPLNFVKFAFPWGEEGKPLARYKEPRKWQIEELEKIGQHNLENQLRIIKGEHPKPYYISIASGRGVGKSAFLGWIALWAMSTQIGGTVIITANTEQQLMSRTWPEVGKWHAMAINSHWFTRTATSLRPKPWFTMIQSGIDSAYYYTQAQLWSEENPTAFAGLHNERGMVVIFDEGAAIPQPIWTVTKGFFTEPIYCRFWFVFSNPRLPDGAFFDCFHEKSKFWHTRHIDSRTVKDLDQSIFSEIIEEFGEDSDEARVEVKGEFPRRGSNQLIGHGLVEEECKRYIKPEDVEGSAKIIGVDVAREGTSKTVIVKRQGLFMHEPIELSIPDNMIVADIIAREIMTWEADACMIDRGEGSGVIDRLIDLGYNVLPVPCGGSANNKEKFLNKRMEMWYDMLQWLLSGGVIPNHKQLRLDLSAPSFKHTPITNKLVLESVDDMKARGVISPDFGSALAFTLAYEVAPSGGIHNPARPKIDDQWDVFGIPDIKPKPSNDQEVADYMRRKL